MESIPQNENASVALAQPPQKPFTKTPSPVVLAGAWETQCAWCLVMTRGPQAGHNPRRKVLSISHGMCRRCARMFHNHPNKLQALSLAAYARASRSRKAIAQ